MLSPELIRNEKLLPSIHKATPIRVPNPGQCPDGRQSGRPVTRRTKIEVIPIKGYDFAE
jgi:hypothetical protein